MIWQFILNWLYLQYIPEIHTQTLCKFIIKTIDISLRMHEKIHRFLPSTINYFLKYIQIWQPLLSTNKQMTTKNKNTPLFKADPDELDEVGKNIKWWEKYLHGYWGTWSERSWKPESSYWLTSKILSVHFT